MSPAIREPQNRSLVRPVLARRSALALVGAVQPAEEKTLPMHRRPINIGPQTVVEEASRGYGKIATQEAWYDSMAFAASLRCMATVLIAG